MEAYSEKTVAAFKAATFKYKQPEELRGSLLKGHAGKPPGQGPFIEIFLGMDNGVVLDATFKTYGCPACIACSKAICGIVKGMRYDQLQEVSAAHLKDKVGALPRAKRHCIDYALGALGHIIKQIESAHC